MPQHKIKPKAHKKYPTELSNQQWKHLKPLLPTPKKQVNGPGRTPLELREVVNGILYWMRSGCSWRLLPRAASAMITPIARVFITTLTRGASRECGNKSISSWWVKYEKKPNARKCLRLHPLTHTGPPERSVKTTQIGGDERGHDAGKCIKGRKRFILVDTLGLLLAVKVVAASVSEKAGAKLLIEKIWANSLLKELCGKLELVWVDAGYQGDELYDWPGRPLGLRAGKKPRFGSLPALNQSREPNGPPRSQT